ncbi:MAG: molybdopterin converting factor subunit 1 [Janthinobacterium lividum]
MKLQLRFFAGVRETLGVSSELVDVPAEVTTVGAVRNWLRQRGGLWEQALADGKPLRMAYDQVMTNDQALLNEGGEVAFFPPVTGG